MLVWSLLKHEALFWATYCVDNKQIFRTPIFRSNSAICAHTLIVYVFWTLTFCTDTHQLNPLILMLHLANQTARGKNSLLGHTKLYVVVHGLRDHTAAVNVFKAFFLSSSLAWLFQAVPKSWKPLLWAWPVCLKGWFQIQMRPHKLNMWRLFESKWVLTSVEFAVVRPKYVSRRKTLWMSEV